MNVSSMRGSYPGDGHTGAGSFSSPSTSAEPPIAFAEQFEFVRVVLLDGVAVADADQDRVRQLCPHQVVEHELQAFVECRRGLVEEGRLRFGQQDAGECDPLLFAGGEHLGPVLHLVEPGDEMREGHLLQHAFQRLVVDGAFLARVADHGAQVAERDVGQLGQEHRLVGSARPRQRARW